MAAGGRAGVTLAPVQAQVLPGGAEMVFSGWWNSLAPDLHVRETRQRHCNQALHDGGRSRIHRLPPR